MRRSSTRGRTGAPTISSPLSLAFVAALGCTTNPPVASTTSLGRAAEPDPEPPRGKPSTVTRAPDPPPPAPVPTAPLLDVKIPVGVASGPLHLVARRYGPLRLQRLTREQLAVRGTLAVALVDPDGQLRRARNDLKSIDLEAVRQIGAVQAFGGRWPDRSYIVGTVADGHTTFPKVWRRAGDAWHTTDNRTYENANELQWQYELSAPFATSDTVAVRVLSTLPEPVHADHADPAPDEPAPARSALVRAFVEVLGPEETAAPVVARAPTPAPTPLHRNADTLDAIPNPDTSPALSDSEPDGAAAPVPDENGLLPTTPPPPPPEPAPAAAPEPVPAASSPAAVAAPPVTPTRAANNSAPPLKFHRLPRALIPRDLATVGGTVYVLTDDGNILQATPRPRAPGKWQPVPDTDLPRPTAGDFIRLHGTDGGQLYVVACLGERPALKHWDGSVWHDDNLPSDTACPTSVAEADGVLWLATAPSAGNTLWQRGLDREWKPVELPRLPWPDLSWERWFAYIPGDSQNPAGAGQPVWERDPPPKIAPPLSPELRASEVVAHRGAVYVLAYAPIGRSTVPHVILSTHRAGFAIEFPAEGEEGLDAEDTGDRAFDPTCTTPFLHLRDLAADEHGADQLPALRTTLGVRPEFADTVLVEALRSDGRRQLGAVWTNADAFDEGFGPLGELGGAIDKLRPEVEPTMLCLIPRVRFGIEVASR